MTSLHSPALVDIHDCVGVGDAGRYDRGEDVAASGSQEGAEQLCRGSGG